MIKKRIHLLFSTLSVMCIIFFITSTVVSEIFMQPHSIARVKAFIVFPGMFILIPSIIFTGVSGFIMSENNNSRLIKGKKRLMPVIALNGLLILVPSAIFLDIKASSDSFDFIFYTVQAVEIIAGGLNLALVSINFKKGLRLSGRLPVKGGGDV